jgi:hypothetical protein
MYMSTRRTCDVLPELPCNVVDKFYFISLPVNTMSTADQLEVTQQERQAYIILSELFLDIEHTPLELQRLSTSLRLLGIPAATLHQL